MNDWCVALVENGAHARAHSALTDLGYRLYLPKYRQLVVRRGRKIFLEGYLFGRYAFVQLQLKLSALGQVVLDWANQFHQIVVVRGVAGVLAVDGAPLLVRAIEVDALRASERRGFVPLPGPHEFKRDEQVRVTRGHMTDRVGDYKFSCDKFDYVEISSFVVKIPRGSIVLIR